MLLASPASPRALRERPRGVDSGTQTSTSESSMEEDDDVGGGDEEDAGEGRVQVPEGMVWEHGCTRWINAPGERS